MKVFPKWFKVRFEQATQESHYWRRLGLADATSFVFENETKELISNRFAIRIIGELSKKITFKCGTEKLNFISAIRCLPPGEINFNFLIPIFNEFLSRILKGNVWGQEFQFFMPTMLDALRQSAETRNQFDIPYSKIPAIFEIAQAFNAFFAQFNTSFSESAIFGLSCQLFKFSSSICVDFLSHILIIKQHTDLKYYITAPREFIVLYDEAVYESRPNDEGSFHNILGLGSLKKCIFKRDSHNASIWHQFLFEEGYNLMGLVFDFHLRKRIPQPAASLLDAYFVGLQTKMRRFARNDGFRKIAEVSFCTSYRSSKYIGKVMKMETRRRMESFLHNVLTPLLNDKDNGIYLFRGSWVDYVMSICNTDERFIDLKEWSIGSNSVTSADPETFNKLSGGEMTSRQRSSIFFWIFAQLLRFVIRLAAHTLRVTVRVVVSNRRLATVTYDGRLEIPDWMVDEIVDNPSKSSLFMAALPHVKLAPFFHDAFLETRNDNKANALASDRSEDGDQ